MKVSELIEQLKKLAPEKEITVAKDTGCGCCSSGYDEQEIEILDLDKSYSIR